MTIAYLLQLPTHLKADAFERFARDRWLPALVRGADPAGQRGDVRLLRRKPAQDGEPIDVDRQFLLVAEGDDAAVDMLRTNDAGIDGLFSAFSVETTRLGGFAPVVATAL